MCLSGVRRRAAWFALLAILLRAFIPAGWIPGDFSAGIPLVICTANGAVTLPFDIAGKPLPAHGQDSLRDAHCVFAAAASLAMPALPPQPSPPSSRPHTRSIPEQQRTGPPSIFDRPPARAPPLFS
jgi:hypothetical protein